MWYSTPPRGTVDLVQSLQGAKQLSDFVDGGGLAEAVADIGVQAALDALKKLPQARDKRAQVWSAVNHLEHAEAAARTYLETRTEAKRFLRMTKLATMSDKRTYLLCLMAIGYTYLGERDLAERALRDAEDDPRAVHPAYASAAFVVNLANPISLFEMLYDPHGGDYWISVPSFRAELRALSE